MDREKLVNKIKKTLDQINMSSMKINSILMGQFNPGGTTELSDLDGIEETELRIVYMELVANLWSKRKLYNILVDIKHKLKLNDVQFSNQFRRGDLFFVMLGELGDLTREQQS